MSIDLERTTSQLSVQRKDNEELKELVNISHNKIINLTTILDDKETTIQQNTKDLTEKIRNNSSLQSHLSATVQELHFNRKKLSELEEECNVRADNEIVLTGQLKEAEDALVRESKRMQIMGAAFNNPNNNNNNNNNNNSNNNSNSNNNNNSNNTFNSNNNRNLPISIVTAQNENNQIDSTTSTNNLNSTLDPNLSPAVSSVNLNSNGDVGGGGENSNPNSPLGGSNNDPTGFRGGQSDKSENETSEGTCLLEFITQKFMHLRL